MPQDHTKHTLTGLLNGEKTEAVLVGTKQELSSILDDITVPLSASVESPSGLLDLTLSLQNFISHSSRSCSYQLCQISSVWKYLSTESTVKLVTSFILSCLDYCSSLLSGLHEGLPTAR